MQDDQFEWDDIKAASNGREHDVAFELAREAFKALSSGPMTGMTPQKNASIC